MVRISIVLAAGLVCLVSSALAGAQNSAWDDIRSCAAVKDDAARLLCYDSAVKSVQEQGVAALPGPPDEAVSEKEEPEFGAITPKKMKRPDPRNFGVESISKRANGFVMVLENGQVWRHNGGDFGRIPKGKLTARIKPASFGTYFLTLKNEDGKTGRKGVRIKRVK